MLRLIDGIVFLGLLIIGGITGIVVAGTRGRQGKRLPGNAAVGGLGSILAGLLYDLSHLSNIFRMDWPPLTELMIFAIIGACLTSLVLVIVRKMNQAK